MTDSTRWISRRDAQAILSCSRQQLSRLRQSGTVICREAGPVQEYALHSFDQDAQERYWQLYRDDSDRASSEAEIYANAPEYARRKADKYLQLFAAAGALSGAGLRDFVGKWNAQHPDFTTSYSRLTTERKNYREQGVSCLLGKWGKRSCSTVVPDSLFAYFKSLYMGDGRPSIVSCWKMVLGHAVQLGMPAGEVPSHSAFARRLKNEVPEQAVYHAREGAAADNRRYGFYIKRHYNDVLAGESWISDHAQIDIACTYDINGKSRVGYPWVTAWRDFKSGLWVGGDIHIEAPNSDHIFMSFFRGAVKHGVPAHLYLDNGKDYRCRDFAGGRKYHKIDIDEGRTTSLTSALGITITYAWPYNAQSKSIERDFLRVKEWFSKHNPGYRGGDVVERPEAHNATIAAGKILPFDDVKRLLGTFVEQVMMKSIVSSGYRAGRAPVDIWNAEYPLALQAGKVRQISKAALKLFCSRTSGVVTIGRRGIHDSQLGVDYYDSWMEGQRGRKVYIRRDPLAMQEAWVFDAATDAYINNAWLLPEVSALAANGGDVSRAELQQAIAIKRQSNRIIRQLSEPDIEIPFHQKMTLLTAATKALRESSGLPATVDPFEAGDSHLVTTMDEAIDTRDRLKLDGLMDLTGLTMPDATVTPKRKLSVFDSDLPDNQQAAG